MDKDKEFYWSIPVRKGCDAAMELNFDAEKTLDFITLMENSEWDRPPNRNFPIIATRANGEAAEKK